MGLLGTNNKNLQVCHYTNRAITLQWHHNGHGGISNHCRLDGLLKSLFRHRSKKTSKLRVTGLCEGNSPVSSEFPSQRASTVKNVSIWLRHHDRILIDFPLSKYIGGTWHHSSIIQHWISTSSWNDFADCAFKVVIHYQFSISTVILDATMQ